MVLASLRKQMEKDIFDAMAEFRLLNLNLMHAVVIVEMGSMTA